MERIDRLELLEVITNLADTGIQKLHSQYFDNSAFIFARTQWAKYFELLDCDTQVEYEQVVLNAFCDYEGIYDDFYWTQGLLVPYVLEQYSKIPRKDQRSGKHMAAMSSLTSASPPTSSALPCISRPRLFFLIISVNSSFFRAEQ